MLLLYLFVFSYLPSLQFEMQYHLTLVIWIWSSQKVCIWIKLIQFNFFILIHFEQLCPSGHSGNVLSWYYS